MITFCSAIARPPSMRVDSEVISIGMSLKLPSWARAPETPKTESASRRSSRFMEGGEAIGPLQSLPREKRYPRWAQQSSVAVPFRVTDVPGPSALDDRRDSLKLWFPAKLSLDFVRRGDQPGGVS